MNIANHKLALITGITGQDGAYLAQLLLAKGYRVVGLLRDKGNANFHKLNYLGITDQLVFDTCCLDDYSSVLNIVNRYKPNEIYNLAAQSSVGLSFDKPVETLNFNILSVSNLLEAIRQIDKSIKFYQASSSEMFGSANTLPFSEESILHPVSPYGISKASAHWVTVNYRESFGIFTTSGILFNHESILRSKDFVIKKIIQTSLDIKYGRADVLEVGNIDIKRDFGFAPKYVEAMYLMMQHHHPDDYVICSGVSLSLREIIYYVFEKLNIPRERLVSNRAFYRANEIRDIYGDPHKAKSTLGWNYNLTFWQVLDLLIEEEKMIYE